MASTIFIVDSSPAVRRLVEQISSPEGYDVVGFQDGPTALDAARKLSPILIITDYHLDNMTFSGFCKEVQKSDNLADTFVVALTGATDKLDESHLKSLGVKAFLKKPFQSENLLDLIKNLDRTATNTVGRNKKRSWPPTTSATDSEDDDVLSDGGTDAGEGEELKITIPFPAQAKPQDRKAPATVPSAPQPVSKTSAPEPEEAMKGLFGQLVQSMTEKAEAKMAELLPALVSKDLTVLLAKAVEDEVQQQVGASLSQERLNQVIEPILKTELPRILKDEMSELEPIIRHSIYEIADPLIKDNVDRMVSDQANKVTAALTDSVQDRLKSVHEQVENRIRQETVAQVEKLVGEIVRAEAGGRIRSAVENLVPTIAETQIKAEIARLTEAA